MSTFGRANEIKFIIYPLVSGLILLSITPMAFAAPSLELSPDRGSPGANIAIRGSGFDLLSRVTVTFGNEALSTDPSSVTTDAMGRFEANFDVPQAAISGKNTVSATSHGILGSSSASATFSVLSKENDPEKQVPTEPMAYDMIVSANEDEEKLITLKGGDQDGDTITFSMTALPTHGTLSRLDASSGNVRYQPERDYTGTDQFSFKVLSGDDVSDPATVKIHVNPVNDPPLMISAHVDVEEDSKLLVALTATDLDSSMVYFYLVEPPDHGELGRLKLTGPFSAEIAYEPRENYNGTDVFKVQVSDGKLYSHVAEIAVVVNPANDIPVASSAELVIERSGPITVTLAATDGDGDMLRYDIISGPRHGKLSGIPPQLEYTPTAGYHGRDEFSFKATDGIDESNVAIVGIWIFEATAPQELPAEDGTDIKSVSPVDNSEQDLVDRQPPRLFVPRSPVVTYMISGESGAAVAYSVSAKDDRDGEIYPQCSPTSGSWFPVGRVNVVCTAKDKDGNTALDSFVVEVKSIGAGADSSNRNQILPGLTGAAIAAAILGIAAYRRSNSRTQRLGPVISMRSRPGFNKNLYHKLRRITNLWDHSRVNH